MIISPETRDLAIEKGFDRFTEQSYIRLPSGETYYPEISQEVIQKWLRDKHNIKVYLRWYDDGLTKPRWSIIVLPPNTSHQHGDGYIGGNSNWELALEKGLQEGIKLIKL